MDQLVELSEEVGKSRHFAITRCQLENTRLTIDLVKQIICVNGSEVSLTGPERTVMLVLGRNPGMVVRREELFAAMYPIGAKVRPRINTVDQHIHKVRKKMGRADSCARWFIRAVRKRGYMLAYFLPE